MGCSLNSLHSYGLVIHIVTWPKHTVTCSKSSKCNVNVKFSLVVRRHTHLYLAAVPACWYAGWKSCLSPAANTKEQALSFDLFNLTMRCTHPQWHIKIFGVWGWSSGATQQGQHSNERGFQCGLVLAIVTILALLF